MQTDNVGPGTVKAVQPAAQGDSDSDMGGLYRWQSDQAHDA